MQKNFFCNGVLTAAVYLSTILFIPPVFAQEHDSGKSDSTSIEQHSRHQNVDARYSVFGPPIEPQWKFQASLLTSGTERVSAFNFYKRNQRDKTIFFSVIENGLDNTLQYRVTQITGGLILFPNDDDRYQFDIGGTYDDIKNTTNNNATIFSRFTYRPNSDLWMRAGFEYYNGYELGHGSVPFVGTKLSSYYAAAKYKLGFISPIAVLGSGKLDGKVNNMAGGGALITGPFNTYAFGGFIKNTEDQEDVRTLAVGKWSPFRPDGIPSGFLVWKHKSDYDFQLGGIFFGNRNLFVQPAAIGMLTGMYISSVTLRVNSQLRQRKLLAISEDYEYFDHSFFYVHLNQKINNGANNVGFSAFQFYKLFSNINLSVFSDPMIGLFYTEETNPEFDMKIFKLVDKKVNFFSYQIGFKIINSFLFEAIHYPSREDITIAISYLIR